MNNLSKKIKLEMKKKRLSAHALEKLAGLKPSVVQNILQGKSKNPTINTIQAISQVLDCPLDELVTQPTENKSVTDNWEPQLYQQAMQLANELFAAHQLHPTKEQALNYIDEIYNYSIKAGSKQIDRQFAEWLISKQFF